MGANGTYINGNRVDKALAIDGMIIRLASSGPKILIKIESEESSSQGQSSAEDKSQNKTRSRSKITKDTLISLKEDK